jgi:hypothetical protein
MCTPTGEENTAAACGDGIDNDCDGFRDCRDRDCTAICGVENSNRTCTDGIDNNMNSFIDCMDFDCQDRIVCRREASNATCSDGIDNDDPPDGLIDCADPNCQAEGIVVCNGATPVAPLPAPSEWAALIATRCSNGVSDDGNAFIDCGDNSCLWNHVGCDQPAPERGNAQCSDGEDNDLDGIVDCDEPACLAEGTVVCRTPGVVPDEAEWETLSNAECTNGINDDASETNTFTDCADNGCTKNPEITVECPGENTNARCSDGIDNDTTGSGVGHIDCADFGCNDNPRVTVCTMVERSFAHCSDGMDNDGDNRFDCGDFDCRPPEDSGRFPSPACM